MKSPLCIFFSAITLTLKASSLLQSLGDSKIKYHTQPKRQQDTRCTSVSHSEDSQQPTDRSKFKRVNNLGNITLPITDDAPEPPYMYQIQIYHLQIIFSNDYPLLSTSLYHAKLKAGCSSTDTISCSLRKFPFLYLFQHLKSSHHSHFHGGLFSMLPKSSFPRHLPRFREMRAEP